MPIDPRTAPQNIDRFLNENLGPINRFLERIMEPGPPIEEVIRRQRELNKAPNAPYSRGVGKPGAPTLTQQVVQGILLALSAGRVGAFRRGPPEFPITTRTYTDPRSGQTFQVPGYDTSRSATHPHEFQQTGRVYGPPQHPYEPPKNIDRNIARLHGQYSHNTWSELNEIRNRLRDRYKEVANKHNELQSRLLRNDDPALHSQYAAIREELDDIVDRMRVVGHRARTADLLQNARHDSHVYSGMEFGYGRFDRGPRGPEGGGPQSKPPVTSSEINDIMQSFGYSRYRDQRGTRGTRGGTDTDYLWYRSNTPDLPLGHKDPNTGLNMSMPASRFLFRIGDHPAARSAAKQNKIDPARFYDISPGSNFRDVEAIRRHLAQRLGVNLPEPPQRTPIPANQLDLFRDYIQGR